MNIFKILFKKFHKHKFDFDSQFDIFTGGNYSCRITVNCQLSKSSDMV